MTYLASSLNPDTGIQLLPDGVLSSALASVGTGLGAIPILFTRELSDRWRNRFFCVGGGVMLASAAFSLMWPALDWASHSPQPFLNLGEVAIALVLGGFFFFSLEQWAPDVAPVSPDSKKHLWLFVLAIALHHLPEGLAVGLGMTANHDVSLAIGVGLQNLPEGLMVALACRELGYSVIWSLTMATLSGWLEPVGGAMGGFLANSEIAVAPIGMALAAGAMLFVVWHELLPKVHFKSLKCESSMDLMTGLLVMGLIEQVI